MKNQDITYSINRAASLVERDRQTLTRALRTVPADALERGQPRYRLPTILNALVAHELQTGSYQRRGGGYGNVGGSCLPPDNRKYIDKYWIDATRLDAMHREYERQVRLIEAGQSAAKRRALALALAPLMQEFQILYLEIGRSLLSAKEDDFPLLCRADLIFSEMMDEVRAAAKLPAHGDDDFGVKMIEAMAETAGDE